MREKLECWFKEYKDLIDWPIVLMLAIIINFLAIINHQTFFFFFLINVGLFLGTISSFLHKKRDIDFINRQGCTIQYSKDYKMLFEWVKDGNNVPCFVDYIWDKTDRNCIPMRDVAEVRYDQETGLFQVDARGIGYSIYPIKTLEVFVQDCKRMNLEFVI